MSGMNVILLIAYSLAFLAVRWHTRNAGRQLELLKRTIIEKDFDQIINDNRDLADEPPEYHCPFVNENQESSDDKKLSDKITNFFTLEIETVNGLDSDPEARAVLENVILSVLQLYASCACPSAVTFSLARVFPYQDLVRIYRARRLGSRIGVEVGVSGKYNGPPDVDLGKTIGDSINNRGRRRLSSENDTTSPMSPESNPGDLIESRSCEDYFSNSLTKRLNETEEHSGNIKSTYALPNSFRTCEDDVKLCCMYIEKDARCNNPYGTTSLCGLPCCCKFRDADCCKEIFKSRCDFDKFCSDAPSLSAVQTYWEENIKELYPSYPF